jgi:hypothetical protein
MDELTTGQRHALEQLARKKAGEAIPFVNISDARALTELGLAERSREGWDITAEGSALHARLSPLKSDTAANAPTPIGRTGPVED